MREKRRDGEMVEERKRVLGSVCRRRSPCLTWTLRRFQAPYPSPGELGHRLFSPSPLKVQPLAFLAWHNGLGTTLLSVFLAGVDSCNAP